MPGLPCPHFTSHPARNCAPLTALLLAHLPIQSFYVLWVMLGTLHLASRWHDGMLAVLQLSHVGSPSLPGFVFGQHSCMHLLKIMQALGFLGISGSIQSTLDKYVVQSCQPQHAEWWPGRGSSEGCTTRSSCPRKSHAEWAAAIQSWLHPNTNKTACHQRHICCVYAATQHAMLPRPYNSGNTVLAQVQQPVNGVQQWFPACHS